ncbi:hypothetical protein LUZ63_008588 [Rhynchospora breviuscula]|uniref:Uncharacterized protein n=1 Tax=Rhynchospora breviuscula TaxID=2022672 RepID=A0A9Q0HVM7_9POAL|nr:hypothetical protein LUZ63_008588 [Rhynchospora breviuscula]
MEAKSTEMGTANPDKNLEKQIEETGGKLESPPTSTDELLSLLDEAEALLTRVDQSPCPSMTSALEPMMAALAAKGMLSHSDIDVRVAVAACISEITRITAPDAPYGDDLMKDLFKRIVESFERLDDLTGRSFSKRVSILETVAKVRSCVVMLDLECDDLILEMFQHFLKTISLKHQDNIFSSMETIMSLVIEESEDISKDLVLCLLQSVRKDRMERLSVSYKLGEKVIRNCADKLKPLVMELIGDKTNEYSKFVLSLCQDMSDAMEQSDVEASAKNAPEESKISERTVSDDRPQESAKAVDQEPEAECPEEVGSAAQNGEVAHPLAVDGNGESIVEEPPSPRQKAERPTRVIKKTTKAKEAETKATPPIKSNKRKATPAKQTESSGSQEVLSDKKEEEAEPKPADPDSSTPVPESGSRPKRGRSGTTAKKAAEAKKEVVEGASDSEGRSLRQSVRKGAAASVDAKQKGGSKSQKKEEGTKGQKKEEAAPATSDGDASEDIRVKDMLAAKANLKKIIKEKANVGESSVSKRKRGPEKEKKEDKDEDKVSGRKKQKIYDESIIGERIKVWWPDDKVFYNGTVGKYNRSDKKHTVTYDDGDIEVLNLKNETWEFVEQGKEDAPAADSSKSKNAKTSTVKEMKETPKSSKSAAKSKAKEPAETPKSAMSSKKDAKSKESGVKMTPKSKSSGPPEKASGAKSGSGSKNSSKRKGGRN